MGLSLAWTINFVQKSAVRRVHARMKWISSHLHLSPQPQPRLKRSLVRHASKRSQAGRGAGLARHQIWQTNAVSSCSIPPLKLAVMGCVPAPPRPRLQMMADHVSKQRRPGRAAGLARREVCGPSVETKCSDRPLMIAALVCVPRQRPQQLKMMDEHASDPSLPGHTVGIVQEEIW